MSKIGVELCINAAEEHGKNSEPDHEVGDLQNFLRTMWEILTPGRQLQFMMASDVVDIIENELGDEVNDIAFSSLLENHAKSMLENSNNDYDFHSKLLIAFPGFINDTEVNGGDLVEWMETQLPSLKAMEAMHTVAPSVEIKRPKP